MTRTRASSWLLPLAALLAGVLGADAAWVTFAVASGRPLSWLSLLVALDVALMLRLSGVRAGAVRVLVAVFATALAVALAQWLIVATQLGLMLGFRPLDSALRLGPTLARQLLSLSLGRADVAWLLASLPAAALFSLRSRRERNAAG